MGQTLKPDTPSQLLETVRWAAAEETPLQVSGRGSKDALGRAVAADHRLDLSGLNGILTYQPEELYLTARAATPLAEVEAALSEHGQVLGFEPGNWSPLLGGGHGESPADGGTLGGAIACNLAGPRRIKAGAARDHLLGFHAVSGRGEEFKSGGTVVKNVTGFDLSKLIAGSYGTLAVITEVTVRVLPAAEDTRTVLVVGCDEACGVRAMTSALQSPNEVSGAAHLPADVAALSAISEVRDAGDAVAAIRIEGPGPSVDHRVRALAEALGAFGTTAELDAAASQALWRELRDVSVFANGDGRQVWRVSVPPSDGAKIVAELLFELQGQAFYDWGGGLIWIAHAPREDAGAELIRATVAPGGGHATLIRADEAVRARAPVFQPQPAPLAALTKRVKEGFDPHRVLNPDRMYEGV